MYPARCPVRKVRVGPHRRGLVVDEAYLRFIRKLPCLVCGRLKYVEAAHVGMRGLGQKCSDRECLPLCSWHHIHGPESHHVLGRKFFEFHKLDRLKLIADLNEMYEQFLTNTKSRSSHQ